MQELKGDFKGSITSLAISPDECWLAANQIIGPGAKQLKQPIRLWDLHDLDKPAKKVASTEPRALKFTPDGQFLAYTGNADGLHLQPFPGPGKTIRALAEHHIHSFLFVPNTMQLLAAGNSPFGWDLEARKPFPVTLEGLDFSAKDPQGRLHAVLQTLLLRPDGTAVAARVLENTFDPRNEDVFESVVTIQSWSYPDCSGRVKSAAIPVDPMGRPAVRQLAYSPDGRFLAGLRAHDVVVWDAVTLKEITALTPSGFRDKNRPNDPSVVCLAFTNDGKRLAAGCKGGSDGVHLATEANISFWDTATWKKGRDVKCPCDRVQVLAFTSSGRMIAVADYTPIVWEPGEYETV
jgi:WD40 repeat protein